MSRWEWQEDSSPFVDEPLTLESNLDTVRSFEHGNVDLDVVLAVHQRLITLLDPQRLIGLGSEAARDAVAKAARPILGEIAPHIQGDARDESIDAICDEVLGLGPIEPLVRDPGISEVMVNAPDEVYWEENGTLHEASVRFRDEEHILRIIQRIVAPLGRRIDESSPYVDARLADGSRVNAVIPPLAFRSPVITIRKFLGDRYTMDDLVSVGTLTPQAAEFLNKAVQSRLNILISGGTGSGKTTLLNALSSSIPAKDRIITIEDPAELRLQQRHVIGLEVRPANIEGRNEVTQRDLVRNALRMRPDRILVGEVRGAEAFDMMQAMNTGHEGSLTTVHANSQRDSLARIENMILMAGFDLPLSAIREQIASALHLIVQIGRFIDGTRRVLSISEVTGLEGSTITLQDLFTFQRRGADADGRVIGELEPTALRPHHHEKFTAAGHDLPISMFLRV